MNNLEGNINDIIREIDQEIENYYRILEDLSENFTIDDNPIYLEEIEKIQSKLKEIRINLYQKKTNLENN